MDFLIEHGYEGIAGSIVILMNSAMQLERFHHLNAALYERGGSRKGYANGYKPETMNTRVGEVQLAIPQTRRTDCYPQRLERGLRSERTLKPALEMYVQGSIHP